MTHSLVKAQDTIVTFWSITNRWTKDKIAVQSNPYFPTNFYPTTAVVTNDVWLVSSQSLPAGQSTIQHNKTGYYLMSFNDSLYLAPRRTDMTDAIWKIEKYNTEFSRISHVKTKSYLNTEKGSLEINKALPGWFSSHWKLVKTSANENPMGAVIQNRWTKVFLVDSSKVTTSTHDSGFWRIQPITNSAPNVWIISPQGKHLLSNNGVLTADTILHNASWQLEGLNAGAWYRIRNSTTGQYIHSEPGKLYLGPTEPGWWQTQWKLVLW
jgi:hypothetical protein